MSNWLHHLPVLWMAFVIFGAVYLIAAGIYGIVMVLATAERTRAFKAISPGMLPPLGVIFGLFVAFLAAQVWHDFDQAHTAVNNEASALRDVVLLASSFPGEPEARLRALVRRHIHEAVTQEWPAMAQQRATLTRIPGPLAEALRLTLDLTPQGNGQVNAQRNMAEKLENALDARRHRIIVSGSRINGVKWAGLLIQAICMLFAIAMVHCENRGTAAISMALFATAAAVCMLLIASHDRPFTGEISAGPGVLLQVMPEELKPTPGP